MADDTTCCPTDAKNCKSDIKANDLVRNLINDVTTTVDPDPNIEDVITYTPIFTVPTFEPENPDFIFTEDATFQAPINDITLEQLTTVELDGSGIFDKLMSAVDLHIKREFKSNRLTGDQYAEVYASSINSVLSTSVQFLLNKDQSKWQSVAAQAEARRANVAITNAKVDLEISKLNASKIGIETHTASANFALTKVQIANADAEHCMILTKTKIEDYQLCNILPAEYAVQNYQRMQVLPASVDISKQQLTNLQLEKDTAQYRLNIDMPLATEILQEQKEKERAQTRDTLSDNITPVSGIIGSQKAFIKQQQESENAKTSTIKLDGNTVITGSIGRQIDLYSQQIDSFDKDAKYKVAKMYLDAWITQKTLDDALLAPTQLQNADINVVLENIRNVNDLQ